ncbi:hypothetical protein A2V82_07530 [candidate division KSB1 bacterium RBG_16_48_16]|nr:MAG: hypothetical protein A2V82_07530 [candidate division KSB1 bacterium RBG_16_48_16]
MLASSWLWLVGVVFTCCLARVVLSKIGGSSLGLNPFPNPAQISLFIISWQKICIAKFIFNFFFEQTNRN